MRLAGALIIAWLSPAPCASAQIPPEQISLMAEYLAKALPERPRPPPKHGRSPHTPKR